MTFTKTPLKTKTKTMNTKRIKERKKCILAKKARVYGEILIFIIVLFIGYQILSYFHKEEMKIELINEAHGYEETAEDLYYRDNARLARLTECNKRIDLLEEYHLNKQDISTRCATIRTLSRDRLPYESIMEDIHTPSKSEFFWEIYYDIKRLRIENSIKVQTEVKQEKVSQRGDFDINIDKLYDFVRKGEGAFQEKAFCDSYYTNEEKALYGITHEGMIRHSAGLCRKWTIGFGTNSYPGEVISYDEAVKRKQEAINARLARITTKCFTENQIIAAVDFIYQYSTRYANQMVHYANTCNEKGAYNYIVAHRDFYKKENKYGMVKRENLRINIFYK